LRQVARQHQDKGLSKTFVAIQDEEPTCICGFYALTLAEIDRRFLPDAYQKRLPQRIPGVRLGRLAVDLRYQKKGLGELLLVDAQRERGVFTKTLALLDYSLMRLMTMLQHLSPLRFPQYPGQSSLAGLSDSLSETL
jgi:GNAT superfamily N-acetyltransferase